MAGADLGNDAGTGTDPSSGVVLRPNELAAFRRDGFLVVDRRVVDDEGVEMVRSLLGALFADFHRLPSALAYDLGDVQHHDGPPEIPEINGASTLEPRLLQSAAHARCLDLARQVLGRRAKRSHDHAICKPANSTAAIEWHQDAAFAGAARTEPTVHIWLALQDTTEANGCVRFIPDAGAPALRPHHPRNGAESHAIVATGVDGSAAVSCPIGAGAVTMHRPTTLHSSGPNATDESRLAWILVFRDPGPIWSPARIRRGLRRILGSIRRRVRH